MTARSPVRTTRPIRYSLLWYSLAVSTKLTPMVERASDLRTTTDLWGINFDWKGEKSAYDAVEERANALGFTLSVLFAEMEQRAVQTYQDDLDVRREGQRLN